MARLDRVMHEARRHLGADEIPVVCVLGREVDGRRRRLVVLTDKRVVVVGRRGESPVVLGADVVRVDHQRDSGTLHLTADDLDVAVRDVDPVTATLLVDHLHHRHARTQGTAGGRLRLLTA